MVEFESVEGEVRVGELGLTRLPMPTWGAPKGLRVGT